MTTKARKKVAPRLVTHRTVAGWLDIDTETLRDWVTKGEFPRPRAIVSQTWFYGKDAIEHFISTGRWPENGDQAEVSLDPEVSSPMPQSSTNRDAS